jgi:hypothetical protein
MSSTYRSMSFAATSDLTSSHCAVSPGSKIESRKRLGERARDDVLGRLIQVRHERFVGLLWPVPVGTLIGPTAESIASERPCP